MDVGILRMGVAVGIERVSAMSDQVWEQRELLPGVSSKRWARVGLISLGIAAISTIALLFTVNASRGDYQYFDPISVLVLGVAATSAVAFWICYILSMRKGRREVAAGYTTSAQGDNEVERRHSPTGVVMRPAGAPDLTKPQWDAAMIRVRAYQSFLTHRSGDCSHS